MNVRIVSVFYCVLFLITRLCFAMDIKQSLLIVNPTKTKGLVNKHLYGTNFVGYDPVLCGLTEKAYWGYANFGDGVWDPNDMKVIDEIVDLAQNAGISMVRFPGGTGSKQYDWKQTVGFKRKQYLYGLDEFIQSCTAIGAAAVLTVSYFTGDEHDAAELVEYVNMPAENAYSWAVKRKENGHLKPYGVKYFEIGNEVYLGDRQNIRVLSPREYAIRYLRYYEAMKLVDPSIQIGVVLNDFEWNQSVMSIVKDKVDFGILHLYPSPQVKKERLEKMDPHDIFGISLAMTMCLSKYEIEQAKDILYAKSGKRVPIAITEYNGGFVQEKPVPYRHSLGTALINADLIGIFMKPELNICMANYWQFNNEYWGMVANGFDGTSRTLNNKYYKRPNYYVAEMYHNYFGDTLIDSEVSCTSYFLDKYAKIFDVRTLLAWVKGGIVARKDYLQNKDWEIDQRNDVIVEVQNGSLVLNFSQSSVGNYYHAKKTVPVKPNTFYRLSGYIKTEALDTTKGVSLEIQDGRGWIATRSALDTKIVIGTCDWTYVEAVYRTLPDADSVMVFARRVAENEPISGKAFFKDVQLREFKPRFMERIPCLSVNASKSSDGKTVYMMVVNKNLEADETVTITVENFVPNGKAQIHYLWANRIDAMNEARPHDDVRVYEEEVTFEGNSFEYTFKKHSLTSIVLSEDEGK